MNDRRGYSMAIRSGNGVLFLALAAAILVGGCGKSKSTADPTGKTDPKTKTPGGKSMAGMKGMKVPKNIKFKDEVDSNVEVPTGLDGLIFVDTKGNRVALKDFVGKKNVVLVFTEGFTGMLCPFCKTQTSRLVANYKKFQALDTQVLVVYPGTRNHLDEFIKAAKTSGKKQVDKVPFPIVLDEKLKAVNFFKIKSNLAHPSTYIIDKAGNIRLAYVGKGMTADRPSIKALLERLESANK